MDASINISMEPFRALVADKLPDSQRSYGFVVQTLIIGVGTWIASNLPWFMSSLGVSNEAPEGHIPPSVLWSFAIGALVFMISILWSIFSTTEEPPADIEAFRKENAESKGFFKGITEIASNFKHMPRIMWKLGVVQFFSWFAFFTMWSFATPALTEHVYHAAMPQHGDADFDAKNHLYNQAANSVGSSMGVYGLSSMAFALMLTLVTAKKGINRRLIHMLSLLAGGLGFLLMTKANGPVPNNDPDSFVYITNDGILNLAFALIGISWGSILSMPYAILSSAVKPEKMGISMGIFNMFIVIPQIVAALGGINWAYKTFLGDAIINTMVLAGISLIIGAASTMLLPKQKG